MERPVRRRLVLAVTRTLRLAWDADQKTFVFVGLLTIAPAVVAPIVVEIGRKVVDLVAGGQQPGSHAEMLRLVIYVGILTTAQRAATAMVVTRQELFARRVYLEAERRFLHKAAAAD